jgi:hypothetical protein
VSRVACVCGLSPARGRPVAANRRLAELLDDPDERAQHLPAAVVHPDEEIAGALERAADNARSRGASAVAAALLERSIGLTERSRLAGLPADDAGRRGPSLLWRARRSAKPARACCGYLLARSGAGRGAPGAGAGCLLADSYAEAAGLLEQVRPIAVEAGCR